MILYFNDSKNCLVTASGAVSRFLPVFSFLDLAAIELRIVDNKNAPRDLSHVKAWAAALDNDFLSSTPVMAESGDDKFDASEAARGAIRFLLDCGSEVWAARTEGKYDIPAWIDVHGFDATGARVERFRIPVKAQTIVNAGAGYPIPNDIATRSWVAARDKSAAEVQYSIDGVTPLDEEPETGASWMRWRKANVGGDWSEWIRIPKGAKGDAATFTIVATETLSPGTPAQMKEVPGSTPEARAYIAMLPQGEQGVKGATGARVSCNPILSAGNGVSDGKRRVWLGSDTDTMTFFDDQYDVSKVVLWLVSANTAKTGNIVLVPSIDGVAQAAVVVPVGATVAAAELPFTGANGNLSIRRDWEDNRDTLRDGTPIAVVVVAWEVHHG